MPRQPLRCGRPAPAAASHGRPQQLRARQTRRAAARGPAVAPPTAPFEEQPSRPHHAGQHAHAQHGQPVSRVGREAGRLVGAAVLDAAWMGRCASAARAVRPPRSRLVGGRGAACGREQQLRGRRRGAAGGRAHSQTSWKSQGMEGLPRKAKLVSRRQAWRAGGCRGPGRRQRAPGLGGAGGSGASGSGWRGCSGGGAGTDVGRAGLPAPALPRNTQLSLALLQPAASSAAPAAPS